MKENLKTKSIAIKLNADRTDFLSDVTEKICYEITIGDEGVYKIEYTKDTIDTVRVFEKTRGIFQHSRIVDRVKDLQDKKWIELFYFEKGKTYFIEPMLKEILNRGTYFLKVTAFEVPANNFRETAKSISLNDKIEGKLDYVKDRDWYKFKVVENSNYKMVYSREISDSIWIYRDGSERPEVPVSQKIFLVNDTVAEIYSFEDGITYFLKIKHVNYKSIGNYIVRFIKE